jgi:hypothetical protein
VPTFQIPISGTRYCSGKGADAAAAPRSPACIAGMVASLSRPALAGLFFTAARHPAAE